MPSYRVELQIGALLSGAAPREVVDAAVASFGSLHVDATDLKVSGGTPFHRGAFHGAGSQRDGGGPGCRGGRSAHA